MKATHKPVTSPIDDQMHAEAMEAMLGQPKLSAEAVDLMGSAVIDGLDRAGLDLRRYSGKSKFVADAVFAINRMSGLPKSQESADLIRESLDRLELPAQPAQEEIQMLEALTYALTKWDEQPQALAGGGGVGSFFGGLMRGFESGSNLATKMREAKERQALKDELKSIASTTADDAGTGIAVTGGGEVASKDAGTVAMMRDQEEFVRAFNGNPEPVEAKPMAAFGNDLIQSDGPVDLLKLRADKMTDAALRHGDFTTAANVSQTRLNALKIDEAEQGAKDKKELRNALLTGGLYPRSRYAEKVAPKVIETMLKQGNAAGAEAFQKFVDSQDGRRYNHRWDKIMRTYANGDFAAALPLITDLYNSSYPDGHTAKITPIGEGRYRFQHLNEAGEVIESGEGGAKELADLGVFTLSPEKRAELTFRSQADEAKARRQLDIEDLRQDRQDARLDRRLSAGKDGGVLTVPQQRKNEEIKAARRQLSGMSREELLRRTQSTTNTGRTNPDYDAQLVSMARLANSRMYGDDHDFDVFQNGTAKPAQSTDPKKPAAATKPPAYNTTLKDQVDARRRFRDSPEVKDYALGKWVPGEGFEVQDKAGNHVGYYD